MRDSKLANRYARALMTLSDLPEEQEAIAQDLDLVVDTLHKNEDLAAVYTGVQFSNVDKKAVVRQIFDDTVSEDILHFLLLLVDKSRTDYIFDIHDAFVALMDEAKGIVDMDVETAFPLDDQALDRVRDGLSQASQKQVRLHVTVNPDLICGIRVQYGDYIIDNSAKAKLEALRRDLVQGHKKTEVRDN
ncbi:ATP synthase F1 subunit delta [Peptococcus simiae]|uniref:ATP synthase F1 subunit delta n=1 Tax=Peptococcus simiae TaxID=1643805 RepID=UPI00398088B2